MPFHTSHSAFRNPHSAFTLVELLVAIAIIGILSALLLGVAARATQQGYESRTRVILSRIDTLVMQEYDTYKNRRVQLSSAYDSAAGPAKAEAQLWAKRELLMLEVPDRWSDVLLAEPEDVTGVASLNLTQPRYLASNTSNQYDGPTALNEIYRRKYFQMRNAGVSVADIERFQGPECLYLFVMNGCGDGEARTLFNESSVGDTDGDGAQEFLDGWGNPIDFLRWAPGFESDRQFSVSEGSDPAVDPWLTVAASDHDPFDIFRVEQRAFRLVPLIYSPGPDEQYRIFDGRDQVIWKRTGSPVGKYLNSEPALSPYYYFSVSAGDIYIGTSVDGDTVDPGAAADNITNHSLNGG